MHNVLIQNNAEKGNVRTKTCSIPQENQTKCHRNPNIRDCILVECNKLTFTVLVVLVWLSLLCSMLIVECLLLSVQEGQLFY